MTNTTFKIFAGVPIMVGTHVAPVAGAVTVHVLLMVGDHDSVMRMAEVAADVMEVAGVVIEHTLGDPEVSTAMPAPDKVMRIPATLPPRVRAWIGVTVNEAVVTANSRISRKKWA